MSYGAALPIRRWRESYQRWVLAFGVCWHCRSLEKLPGRGNPNHKFNGNKSVYWINGSSAPPPFNPQHIQISEQSLHALSTNNIKFSIFILSRIAIPHWILCMTCRFLSFIAIRKYCVGVVSFLSKGLQIYCSDCIMCCADYCIDAMCTPTLSLPTTLRSSRI